ncbi:MAG: hypothetical protein PHE82_06175 [Syntrophomonadaceae bacterium]|nr:hypothetical protein [Syntrophomonadaceae bacterium]
MQTLSASEVRSKFSEFVDTVVRKHPVAFSRRRDNIVALSQEQLDALLTDYEFNVQFFNEENGSITASLEEIDLVANASTREEVVYELAEQLKEYAEDYLQDFQLLYNSPNRRKHYPYVLRVAVQENTEAIRRLINA